jgi:hypothetical protein
MAAHKRAHVLSSLVRKVNVKGKKGDVVNLPAPTRGTASSKAVELPVNTIIAGGTGITVPLTQHWEYSRMIEDIAEVHALSSMRKFYTDDAGYALAKAKDDYLFVSARTLVGNAGTTVNLADNEWTGASIAGDGITAYVDATGNANATAITDAGIRRAIQSLDEANFPMNDRFLALPPVARRVMMGLARFSEQAFKGDGDVIKNGKLGNVYGVSVHVTTNAPTPSKGTTVRIGLLAHQNALVLCDVMGPRVQTQYMQEHLGTLLTADTIFGSTSAYASGGIALAMPA